MRVRMRAAVVVSLLMGSAGLAPTPVAGDVGAAFASLAATTQEPRRSSDGPKLKPKIAKAARASGQAPVVVTTPTSRVVRRGERVRAEYFSSPEFVRTDGGWERLSGALEVRPGAVASKATAVPIVFGRASDRLATLSLGESGVSFTLEGARGVRPTLTRSGVGARPGVVRYPDALDGVDLEYEVRGASVKESLVLADASTARSFTFTVKDPKHTLGEVVELGNDSFAFSRQTDQGMAVSLASPMAWSEGKAHTAAPGDGSAWQDVTRTRTGYRIEVGLDLDWAASASFPVVLDPTMEFSWADGTLATAFGRNWYASSLGDCDVPDTCPAMFTPDGSVFVAQEHPNDEPSQLGYAAFVQLNLSNIPYGTRISSASLSFDMDRSGNPDGEFYPTFAATPSTAQLSAGDAIPIPDNWGANNDRLVSDFFIPETPPEDPTVPIAADVTNILRYLTDNGAGDHAGITIGSYPGCWWGVVCRQAPAKRQSTSTQSVSTGFANSDTGRWLRNASLVIEYEGAVLPPPLPVDQTFGCVCGEWGTGADAVAHDADPINTATGQSLEIAVDAPLARASVALPWGRVLNGPDDTDGPLGVGWTHPYNASLSEDTDGAGVTTATFRDPTGGRWRWTKAANGSYVPTTGVTAELEATPGGGWSVRSTAGRTITFDTSGRETSDVDRLGGGVTLTYASGRLSTLIDSASGGVTMLTYGTSGDSAGRIVEVDLPGGRSVTYNYTEIAGSVRLASVEDVTGETTTYSYTGDGALDGITDPEGNTRAVNTYGPDGRVIGQAEPTSTVEEPHEWTFDWQDRSGGLGNLPDGTGVHTTTDPDGYETKQFYYGNVMFRSVDAAGGSTDYTYDADANLVAVTDPLGYVTTMTYDTRGNLLTRTSPAPESITETWTYNTANQTTSYSNGAGETATYSYTGGLQTAVTDPEGGITQNVFDTDGRLVESTSPQGRTTEYDYDSAGNLQSETSPSGATVTYTYDAVGNLLTETTARGNTTNYTYDEAGRVLTATNPTGTVTTHSYDGAGRNANTVTTSPSNEVLRETGATYDPVGRVLTQSLFDRTVVTNTYTPGGRVSYSRDAEDRDTYYDYDQTGRPVGRSGPGPDSWTTYDAAGRLDEQYVNGIATSYTYDSAGRQISATTGDSTTETAYDDADRPIEITDPDGGVTVMVYDDNGRLVSQAAPGRQPVTFTYDDDGHRLSETSPSGLSTRTWTYTPDGQVATETSPRGNAPGAVAAHFTTSYDYDLDGNQTSRTDPLGRTWSTVFNNLGLPVENEDPRGHSTGHTYDRLGQLTTVTAADDSETTYTYNQYGDRISRTDARDNTTEYTYDGAGQLLTETDPLDRAQIYTYDWEGNRETHTNARGQTITYGYDWGTDRVTSRTYGNSEDYFSYDAAGRLASFIDSTGTTEFAYNGRGLLTGVDQPGDDDFSYIYTPAGSVASRTYPSGATIDYTHTLDGLPATQERNGRTTAYTWDRDQNLTEVTYPASVDKVETRVVDRAGRVSSIQTTQASTSAPIMSIDYDRNEVGSPTSITRTRGNNAPTIEAFAYNDRDWLTRWCPDAQTCAASATDRVQYEYDSVGNQTSEVGNGDVPDPGTIAITYDDADQRTSTARSGGTDPGTTTHQWDADGNLIDRGQQYDQLGRLTAADAIAGGSATYTYNALGQRRSTTRGSDVTNWSWDINNPLPQLAQSRTDGQPSEEYDYTPDGWTLASWTGGPAGQTHWYTHDALGSLMDAFDETGTETWQRSYDPWGTITDDTQLTPGAPRPVFGYTSAIQDPATMVWHLRARDYNPSLRAFSAPDSMERPTDQPRLSTYGYADLQPALLSDPSGRCTDTYCPPPQTPTYCLASGAYCSGPPPVHGPAAEFDVHTMLGLIGIVFPPADALNAVLYASDGDYVNAGVSILCMVPIAGDGLAISRVVKGGAKAGNAGPGVWKTVNEVMSPRAAAYQARITGRAADSAYVVNGVKFDGFANGVLLDAKGPGYATFVRDGQFEPFFGGADALVSQAQRQLAVAGGARIQWSVAEAETTTAIKNLLASRGISGILVTHVP